MDFDKMTNKQIADHIMNGDNYTMQESLLLVTKGCFGEKPDQKEAFKLIRKALKENKTFYCAYYDGESCDGAMPSGFEMWIR
ncbi:MAG: hypothetical protein PUH21_06770 [Prevotellaceae bacterium]|nr:hypothetical protein [Prevotellaceae bacterium]MDY3855722.1 hypothetical protein [Bacteroidaceae bacterium]MDY4951987.1 hypothetical protein [Prevotella sp.]